MKPFLILMLYFVGLTSFNNPPKPHLIVGLWKITEENKITLNNTQTYINQLYFGSDELSSHFYFTDKKGNSLKEKFSLAYQTYETLEDYTKPVVYFINTCDSNFRLAFTIEKLTKDSLELKNIKEVSPKELLLNKEILKFERIAGPPENMSHSEDAIQIEINIDEK